MPSTFSWLDHSEHDRRRVLEAIDRFAETDTRDELGLGAIRDGFADLFFPGTSTIQTRARYFLFIPWLYRTLEEKKAEARAVEARARKAELALLDSLLASDDHEGLIGKQARASLKRLPSSAYWSGLGTLGIRLYPGSQDDYHRNFDALVNPSEDDRDEDGDPVHGRRVRTWCSHLPKPPPGFPEKAHFRLRSAEAQFLAERIVFSAPESLFALFIRKRYSLDVPFPWMHPQLGSFPAHLRTQLHHAQLFAEAMHGAALLYNLLLAESLPGEQRDALVADYSGRLQEWCDELAARQPQFEAWDRDAFWELVRAQIGVRHRTEQFVERWVSLRPWRSLAAATGELGRALLKDRERQLKGGRARIGNSRAMELWRGESGAARLSYRWAPAARILRDIYEGLEKGDRDVGA